MVKSKKQNANKFLSQLNQEEISIFESIAGDTLARYGYQPQSLKSQRKALFTDSEMENFDKQNEAMKREALIKFDIEGVKKRKGQEELIAAIKSRKSKNRFITFYALLSSKKPPNRIKQ